MLGRGLWVDRGKSHAARSGSARTDIRPETDGSLESGRSDEKAAEFVGLGRSTWRNRVATLNRAECRVNERAPIGAGPWGLTSGAGARSTSPPAALVRGRRTGLSSALPLPPVVIVAHSVRRGCAVTERAGGRVRLGDRDAPVGVARDRVAQRRPEGRHRARRADMRLWPDGRIGSRRSSRLGCRHGGSRTARAPRSLYPLKRAMGLEPTTLSLGS